MVLPWRRGAVGARIARPLGWVPECFRRPKRPKPPLEGRWQAEGLTERCHRRARSAVGAACMAARIRFRFAEGLIQTAVALGRTYNAPLRRREKRSPAATVPSPRGRFAARADVGIGPYGAPAANATTRGVIVGARIARPLGWRHLSICAGRTGARCAPL